MTKMGLFGFGGSEMTGYNCEQVNALRDVMNYLGAEP